MENDIAEIGFVSYLMSGLAYTALAVYLLFVRKGGIESIWLTVAIFISAIWSIVTGLSFEQGGGVVYFLSLLETLRGAAWVIFFALLLSKIWQMQGSREPGRKLLLYIGIFLLVLISLNLLEIGSLYGLMEYSPMEFGLPARYNVYGILIICITIFLLVENLYRNSVAEGRWGIMLLLLSVAALFIYDFLLFADTLLFTAIGDKLYQARGLVNFIVVPVIAVAVSRNPNWALNIQISRKIAFHTVTLIGTGAYLIGMSAAGYFLQNFTGKWGDILQATFILAALLGLVVFITSGKFRAQIKVFLTKHFYKYRYDYREEWLKFISTISETGEHYRLRERVIKALADVVDSPGGALWICEQPDAYQKVSKWNFSVSLEDELPVNDEFINFLVTEKWIVDLKNEIAEDKIIRHDCTVPQWMLSRPEFWLVLPLVHLGKLVGFVILLQPRVKNTLNWESIDLLKTIGRQVASYLAEQISEIALAEAREFESFNRKFAFVVHDIKNLTSQLSLMVKNAEKHAHNPEFQKDMVLTVQNSVEKMNSLLSRITVVQEPAKEKLEASLDISRMMEKIIRKYRGQGLDIKSMATESDLYVIADAESVETIFMHLIENAREACDPENIKLEVHLSREGGYAIIKVIDNGHGMDAAFIQNELFRPFRSTKENGYGIGAYESREMIKRLGGKLDVKSEKNVGTIMKVCLRLAAQQQQQNELEPVE